MGKLVLEQKEFSVEAVVEDMIDVVCSQLQQKRLNFSYSLSVSETGCGQIVGDMLRLRQVLLNLVNNAIKFTDEGGEIELVVRTLRAPSEVDRTCELEFSVRDTGIGIEEKDHASLFSAFSQVDASTTRKFGGTGLGLAIAKRLIERMNGNIWCESKPGEGSTFFFTIKAPVVEEPPDNISLPDHICDHQSETTVLLLEENDTTAMNLLSRFRSFNYGTVLRIGTEEELLNAIRETPESRPLIILCPCELFEPEQLFMTEETLNLLRNRNILALLCGISRPTSIDSIEDISVCFLRKPIKDSHLRSCISKASRRFSTCCQEHSQQQQQQQATSEQRRRSIDLASSCPMRILTVEDNPMIQRVVTRMLASLGYPDSSLETADNGADALQKIEEAAASNDPFDCVLLDISMPVMDGIECVQRIRTLPFCSSHYPFIIALTANAFDEDQRQCLDAGCNAFLAKPIRSKESLGEHLRKAFSVVRDRRQPSPAPQVTVEHSRSK